MKKWVCKVCGYIHEGEEPPSKCPVCGSPKEMFFLESLYSQSPKEQSAAAADILVVGSGAAAFAAAVTAKQMGASVIMLEKAPQIGGTTARSGGGYWIPLNRWQRQAGYSDDWLAAIKYMCRYSFPHIYSPDLPQFGLPMREYSLIEAYVENAHKMADYFDKIGALKSMLEINWTQQPQLDYMDHFEENGGVRGRSIFPKKADGTTGFGVELIDQMSAWAREHRVEILTNHRAKAIITDDSGRVTALDVEHKGETQRFFANVGVIFATGGYSHNSDYMLSFQRGPHYGGCAVPQNTGDFIAMAGEMGAKIGNMAGAFRADSMIEMHLQNPGGSSNVFYIAGDSVLMVNRFGRRYVNEKRNYTDRAMAHFQWDSNEGIFKNMLTFMIFDERTATLWQGFPPYPVAGEDAFWIIEGEGADDLAGKIASRLKKLAPFTGSFELDAAFLPNLKDEINNFNTYAKSGKDPDFNRGDYGYDREWTTFPPTAPNVSWPQENPNITMHPLDDSKLYAIILAAGTLDTNGGPVIDQFGRVLNWQDKPIKGLYGAGNCISSPTANAYWGAGSTIGPAMTFGYIAARHALKNLP